MERLTHSLLPWTSVPTVLLNGPFRQGSCSSPYRQTEVTSRQIITSRPEVLEENRFALETIGYIILLSGRLIDILAGIIDDITPTMRHFMKLRITLLLSVLVLAVLAPVYAADVSGTWTAAIDTPIGLQNYTYDFQVDGETLTGKAILEGNASELKNGKVSGDKISFSHMMDAMGQEIEVTYTGTVSGDEIKFSRKVGDFGVEDFVAKRSK